MSAILYDNIIEGVTPTATNQVAGHEGIYVTNWLLYNAWKSGATGTQYLTFDLKTAKQADCLAIYGHNLSQEGCTVNLKYSSDNTTYLDAFSGIKPTSSGVIFKQFAQKSARYWRVEIINSTANAVVSVVSIGTAFVLPSSMYDGFKPPVWAESTSINSIAENGNFLGSVS